MNREHDDARGLAIARQYLDEVLGARWDLIVIGGGNAGLVTALSARQSGRRVLLLERAPVELRGGNTRHARSIRCVQATPDAHGSGTYLFDDFLRDLSNAGEGPINERLATMTVAESESLPTWMGEHGVRWRPAHERARHHGRATRLLPGGGKALINTYHSTLATMGVTVLYGALVEELTIQGDTCTGVVLTVEDRGYQVGATAVVCASSGLEANLDWLGEHWGDAATNYVIRGCEYNDGTVLNALVAHGASTVGDEKNVHAVPVDARSPRFDGGIATRLDAIPFGILVDREGRRFSDEGEILPHRYATWGRRIADQPGQVAYAIWDAKVNSLFRPPMYGPFEAHNLAALARTLALDERTLRDTVALYNDSLRRVATFDCAHFDGLGTIDLNPPKSNWAQRIDQPPYYGVAMRPGTTFAYRGVAVTEEAKVMRTDGTAFSNVFAAGGIMLGNILPTGYLSGVGLTVGSVWGRIAGRRAARVEA